MRVPKDLTEVFYNTVTEQSRQAGSGGTAGNNEELSDVFFAENPGMEHLTITADALGNVSGDIIGTLTANGDKTATLTILGEGALILNVNVGVNFLTTSEIDTNSHAMIVAVKSPTSSTLADAEGIWRWEVLEIPARLREQYRHTNGSTRISANSDDFAQENEELFDVYFSGDLDAESGLITIDDQGNVTGSDPGTLSTSGTSFTFTPADSSGDVALYPSASKESIIGFKTSVDELLMVVLVKISDTPARTVEALVDVQLTVLPNGNVDLTWNESSSFCLSKSDNLGAWDSVSGSQGASSHTDTSAATKGFYRVEVVDD